MRRGVDRAIAQRSVAAAELDEDHRARIALQKLFRTKPSLSYPSAARALQRYGFPAPLIYRLLREHAATHGPLAMLREEV